jgi:hypothetical protein
MLTQRGQSKFGETAYSARASGMEPAVLACASSVARTSLEALVFAIEAVERTWVASPSFLSVADTAVPIVKRIPTATANWIFMMLSGYSGNRDLRAMGWLDPIRYGDERALGVLGAIGRVDLRTMGGRDPIPERGSGQQGTSNSQTSDKYVTHDNISPGKQW